MRQAGSVPIHLAVDSTGLKIFGAGEWLAQKHNTEGITAAAGASSTSDWTSPAGDCCAL